MTFIIRNEFEESVLKLVAISKINEMSKMKCNYYVKWLINMLPSQS